MNTVEAAPRKSYATDLNDAQWELLVPHLPAPKRRGRKRKVDLREIINAILYLNRSSCQWRLIPHDLPKKSTVFYYYQGWQVDGTWERFLTALREETREDAGKQLSPSQAIIDSQSVKTAGPGEAHGVDAHKKVNGRKRHVLVDTLGLLLVVLVTTASALDGAAGVALLNQVPLDQFPRLLRFIADLANTKCGFPAAVTQRGCTWETRRKDPEESGFKPIKWRWIVERTLAWLGRCRRNSKDYEKTTISSETMLKISCINLMLNRLQPKQVDPPFKFRRKTAV